MLRSVAWIANPILIASPTALDLESSKRRIPEPAQAGCRLSYGRRNRELRRRIRAGSPVHPRRGARLPDRRTGAGATAAHATNARRGGRSRHRRLHLGLPGLAPRRVRHGSMAGPIAARGASDPIRAGGERGPGGHRRLGIAAGEPARRRPPRWRLRNLVRQGSGGGPFLRRPEARELRGLLVPWRRVGTDGRRCGRQVVIDRPPERARPGSLWDSDPEPLQRSGLPRSGSLRLGAFPLLRLLGGIQVSHRHRRQRGFGGGGRRTCADLTSRRLRSPGGWAQHQLDESSLGRRSPPVSTAAARGPGLRSRQRTRPGRARRPAATAGDRHHGKGLPRRAPGPRRARTRRRARGGVGPIDLQGGAELAPRARGHQAFRPRPRRHPRRRGEASADGRAAGAGALQPGGSAPTARQSR